jgi:hypothetical protein
MGCVINNLGLSCGVAQVGLCGDSNLRGAVVALSKACSRHEGNTGRKGDIGLGLGCKQWDIGTGRPGDSMI